MKNRGNCFKRNIDILVPLAVLLIGIIAMLVVSPSVSQASSPLPMAQSFLGEYSYDNISWFPIEDLEELSAFNEDLYLRGHFEVPIPPDVRLYFYSDHIGSEIYVNGELFAIDFLLEMDKYGVDFQPSVCRKGWDFWYFFEELPADADIEIHLKNFHSFGNERAYEKFLSTICCTPGNSDFLSQTLSQYSRHYTVVGIILLITCILLSGSALASIILRAPVAAAVAKMGLLAGFAGGFFIFDTLDLTFWSENNVLNTYGWHISLMYTVYFLGIIAKDMIEGSSRKLAKAVMAVSAAINAVIILLSFTGVVLIYDTLLYWVIIQMVICPILVYCCASELIRSKNNKRPTLIFLLVVFFCIMLDIIGIMDSMYSYGNLTKFAFIIFFVYVFSQSASNIIENHKASALAQKLEKELEESRISIMLSQIQPHFMFNVLGTIRGLCREDPEQAWRGLGDFSTYLRGNMNALTNTKSIPFETELRHVETYLRLERMRLGDRLSIVYNIQERNFHIPPLTLQPLVENAVKHGIFYKTGGGTIIIHSRRENGSIVISVQDDGVGFDTVNPEPEFDLREHVGLQNVRSRVEKMLGGTLSIESKPNHGTTVTLEIPTNDNALKGV